MESKSETRGVRVLKDVAAGRHEGPGGGPSVPQPQEGSFLDLPPTGRRYGLVARLWGHVPVSQTSARGLRFRSETVAW